MIHPCKQFLVAVGAVAGLSGPVPVSADDRPMPAAVEAEGVYGNFARVAEGFVGGQPDEDALRALAAEGIKTIINVRTPGEMEDLYYDEAALAKELGMKYVHIPVGGEAFPYSKEVLDQVAAAIGGSEGEVFLHCRSGTRASHIWTAWLVTEKQMSVDAADVRGKAIKVGVNPQILAKLTGQ